MSNQITRRGFIATSAAAGTLATLATRGAAESTPTRQQPSPTGGPLQLGLTTYMLGSKWDIDTIIKNLSETKWKHAQLRTTHAHGVEVTLGQAEREKVRKRFEDAGIALSLGSAFQYHSPDPAALRKNIEGTKEFVLLASAVGAKGIRVFPNAIPSAKGEAEVERTMERIGKAVAECGRFGADHGVELRLEAHGQGTTRLPVIKRILDYADSPHVYVIWNCNPTDTEAPGFEANFNLVKDRIRNIHLHDLHSEAYPYRELFRLLRESGYQGYCDAEVSESLEPVTFMRYYRALFLALQDEM